MTQLTRIVMILVMKCPKTGKAFFFGQFYGRSSAALLIKNGFAFAYLLSHGICIAVLFFCRQLLKNKL